MAIDNLPACGVMTGDDIKSRVDLLVNQSNDPIKGNDALKASIDSVDTEVVAVANELAGIQGGLNTKIVAGVIRNSGSGWELIDDSFHTGINIDSITNDSEKITVDYASISASKVITFVVGCDETYASLGYSVGSSVAKTKAEIFPSKIAGNGASGLLRYNSAAGGTITAPFGQDFGITAMAWDAANKLVVIDHENIQDNHLSQQPLITPRRSCKDIRIEAVTNSQTSFYFVDSSGVKVEPSDGDQFFFSRGVDSIKAKIDPNLVSNSIGNFWFIGIMEAS